MRCGRALRERAVALGAKAQFLHAINVGAEAPTSQRRPRRNVRIILDSRKTREHNNGASLRSNLGVSLAKTGSLAYRYVIEASLRMRPAE